jgi:hypothetical protein
LAMGCVKVKPVSLCDGGCRQSMLVLLSKLRAKE